MGVEQGVEQWPVTAADVFSGLADWRAAHPRATFQEIERTLDERLALLRARMLEDLALASRQADVQALAPEERPACPACGGRVEARGGAGGQNTATDDDVRTADHAHAQLCGLSRLRDGPFPPWMRSWRCHPAT